MGAFVTSFVGKFRSSSWRPTFEIMHYWTKHLRTYFISTNQAYKNELLHKSLTFNSSTDVLYLHHDFWVWRRNQVLWFDCKQTRKRDLIHKQNQTNIASMLNFSLVRRGHLLDGDRWETSESDPGALPTSNVKTRCNFLWHGDINWRSHWENIWRHHPHPWGNRRKSKSFYLMPI